MQHPSDDPLFEKDWKNSMDILIIAVAIVVVAGGAALAYFLVKKYLNKDDEAAVPKAKPENAKKSEEAKHKPADEKKKAASEKRKAEMMKKIEIAADPKVLEHHIVKKAAAEITKAPRTIDRIEVRANRIDWIVKEDCTDNESGSVFFDDHTLHRLEQGEMKLVAEHIYGLVKSTGFELSEEGSGEKGTFRYHIDKYIIKSL